MSTPAAGTEAGPSRARRLLFGDRAVHLRFAWTAIAAVLLLYTAGFFWFYPAAHTNDDEVMYLNQARLLVLGTTTVTKIDPLTEQSFEYRPHPYPLGTALLSAPFVRVLGWRGAYLMPLLCLLGAVLFTARWLQDAGRSPLFALTVLAFPAVLVLGRVVLSDVPSATFSALGLWLFWRGQDRGPQWWLAAGLVAGLGTLVRESNALLFVPLFAGAVLRGERQWWALLVGGLCGSGLRLLSAWLAFGDPFFVKDAYTVALTTLDERLPLYLFGLLVLVPGGLYAGFAYRGWRRPEIVATVAIFLAFYVLQPFGMTGASLPKRIVIALRYFIPLLPLLAWALAEVAPRVWQNVSARLNAGQRARLETASALALLLALGGLGAAAVGVHLGYDRWSASQAQIKQAIHAHTGDDSVLIVDWFHTRKHLRTLERTYRELDRREVDAADLNQLVERYGQIFLVLFERSDSDYWLDIIRENERFLEGFEHPPELLLEQNVTASDHLRIWRLGEGTAGGEPG